jgi:phosphate transport system protein
MTQHLEGHTVHRYDGELNHVHTLMLEMGGLCHQQVKKALNAVSKRDTTIAQEVLHREAEIDQLELKIDQEIATIFAMRCPVAQDLRILMSFAKAVTDFERIGDEAARIADITLQIYENDTSYPNKHMMRDIKSMGKLALETLTEGLEVFDSLDINRAEQLASADEDLDEEFRSALRRQTTFVMEDGRNLGHGINIVLITKAFERIGEHAVNLAEYVIYTIKGKDVRHQSGKP